MGYYPNITGLKMSTGAGVGKLLSSDADGDASWAYNPYLAMGEPTGLETVPALSEAAGVISLTGNHIVWVAGVRYAKTTDTVDLSVSANGVWYIYYDISGVLTKSQTEWNFLVTAPVIIVYKNGASYFLYDERHGINMTTSTHKYLHGSRGTAWVEGLVCAPGNTSLNIGNGSFVDEDNHFAITGANPYQVRVFYRDASLNWLRTALQDNWWKAGAGGRPQWDDAGTLTEIDNAKYGVHYLVAVNGVDTKIISFMGQASYNTLTLARESSYDTMTWGTLPTPEMKALYKIIVQATVGSGEYVEIQDLRGNIQLTGTAPALTDHGSLGGLTDLDHPASSIINTPAGNIVAVNVQTAINELDTEKAPLASPTFTGTVTTPAIKITTGAGLAKVLTSDADGDATWETPASVSGDSMSRSITQATHGFAIGDVLYHNGTIYVKAKADVAATSEVVGIVSATDGANAFTLLSGGYVTGLTGLTAGSVYFLSPTTAGALTATEPTTEGYISKPLLIANSTTTGYLFNMRGFEVTATSISHYRSFVNADLSTGVLTVTHGLGHKYCSVTVIDNNEKIILPDDVTYVDNNSLTVTLTTYGAITGTWRVVVLDVGATLATPVPVATGGTGLSTFDEQRLMGRITGGQVAALTAAQTLTLLDIGQAWTTPAFDAANFTASGAMTWTVAAGDVVTYAYTEIGKTMTVLFAIFTATLGGTAGTRLKIKVPNGKTIAKTCRIAASVLDGGLWEPGFCEVVAADTNIQITRANPNNNFTLGNDTNYAMGSLTFEIN